MLFPRICAKVASWLSLYIYFFFHVVSCRRYVFFFFSYEHSSEPEVPGRARKLGKYYFVFSAFFAALNLRIMDNFFCKDHHLTLFSTQCNERKFYFSMGLFSSCE